MRTYSNKVYCRQFAVSRTTISCSSIARHSPHCRLHAFQCAWVHWTRKLAAEQSRSKARKLFSVDSVVADGVTSKFQTLISWSKFWSTFGLSEARTHWTERLISCQKRLTIVIKAKVVILNFVNFFKCTKIGRYMWIWIEPTNLQNFTQKDLTEMKIFLKVLFFLGGGYFFETPRISQR